MQLLFFAPARGTPLSAATRARIAGGQSTSVIVEFNGAATDRAARTERGRRGLLRDDSAVLAIRSSGYRAVKSAVEGVAAGVDAERIVDYAHFPLSVWRVASSAALERLRRQPAVVAVHENSPLHAISVSDLPFINQPQTAAQGAIGAGTTIAVIDGGLGSNYLNFPDFGTCTAVATPAATCRVVYNVDLHPGESAETLHGTNVSAIALGVAPGAKLAMFDVFTGTTAFTADLLSAMNSVISLRSTYNIVAMSLSIGDGTSNAAQCTGSVYNTAVSNASSAGIVTVVAAGNNGSKTGLANPGCVPGVVSVGAVYDASYGTVSWQAPMDAGGQCTDASAADKVTCFSQSASYLTLLAPGTFVNAPSAAFQQSGTSQATPHVAGAIAVLRARYPTEPVGATVQRLQLTGVRDTDAGNGLAVARLNLLAAVNQGTAVTLSGSGPTTSTAGATASYSFVVTNNGPLTATNLTVTDTLPFGAEYVSASPGCTFDAGTITCAAASLAVGSSIAFAVTVRWDFSGPVFATASVAVDQINSAAAGQQAVAIGEPPIESADAPLPVWAYVVLAMGLLLLARRSERAVA